MPNEKNKGPGKMKGISVTQQFIKHQFGNLNSVPGTVTTLGNQEGTKSLTQCREADNRHMYKVPDTVDV